MPWFRKTRDSDPAPKKLLERRFSQFGQLLRNYGQILDLVADAAEKQGGGFVLDRQYIVSLAEDSFNLAKAVVFDYWVMTGRRSQSFLALLERFETEGREILASGREEKRAAKAASPEEPAPEKVDAEKLARAISGHAAAYRGQGLVAARGVAGGPVVNLKEAKDLGNIPTGSVWVVPDLNLAVDLGKVIKEVAAILSDTGGPESFACRLARRHHVPAIVGMGDVTARLKTGAKVTVDADENAVYEGLIPELIEYYRQRLSQGQEDEPEYQLLRQFRRRAFPLTLSEVRNRNPGTSDVNTLHDLVHLAHELAGESLFRLASQKRILKQDAHELRAEAGCAVLAVDLGAQAVRPAQAEQELSLPLKAFLRGVKDFEAEGGPGKSRDGDLIIAATRDAEANLIMPGLREFDMAGALLSDNDAGNYIYCRFDSRSWDLTQKFIRRDAAFDILSRLGFAAAETFRAVTAWMPRLGRSDLEKQVVVLGRLWAFLKERDREGWKREAVPDQTREFMRRYAS